MLAFVDTGILLRLDERSDPWHLASRQVVRRLRAAGDTPVAASQSIAEFWNVCTRPATSRGGFGLSIGATLRKLRLVERLVLVLPESPLAYLRWRQLIVQYGVLGAQVHDARLVAQMLAYGITHIATFNRGDFARYSEISVIDPLAITI